MKIISHYRVMEEIGRGGMGVVYKAEDMRLNRPVALKMFPSIVTASAEDRARFFQEARLASRLNHPNIVTIYEFDEIEGTAFIASEYVEGRTLSDLLNEVELPMERVFDLGMQVATGIAEAHAHGIVHRDIKPDNVMVSVQGVAKVMDFGLARLLGSSHVTNPGSLIGTFSYMSPEQVDNVEVDTRSDIFSFGAMLYQMIAGRLPFHGKTVAELLSAITRVTPEPPGRKRAGTPPELDRIALKALQKPLDRRYASMSELIADLSEVRRNPGMSRKTEPRVAVAWSGVIAAILIFASFQALLLTSDSPPAETETSVAVLPFRNIGSDTSANFLRIGLTDDIITRLSFVKSIQVKPTSAVSPFEESGVPAVEAGRRLGAGFALSGSFQKTGDRLHVSPQLIDVSTGNVVWSDQMDVRWEELGPFRDVIARYIVEALNVTADPGAQSAFDKSSTVDPDAHEHYLRGIAHMNRSSRENNLLAIDAFERAIELDSGFAQAYARVGDLYVEQFWSNYSPDTSWVSRGIAMADRALALDDGLAFAHTARGFGLRVQGKYAEGAVESFRALTLDPHNSGALEDVGVFYQHVGKFDRAKEIFRQAARYDPSFNSNRTNARVEIFRGNYMGAIAELQRALQRSPDDAWLRAGLLSLCYSRLGDFKKAEGAIATAERSEPSSPQIPLARAILFAARNDGPSAEAELEKIARYIRTDYAMARQAASVYAKTGNEEKALEWMSRAKDLGNYWYSWYLSDPWFDAVRERPEFAALMASMKRELDIVETRVREYGY